MCDEPEYLNISEAAEVLGTTRKTVYSMIKSGRLQAIPNPIDAREKLIERAQVEQLAKFVRPKKAAA